MRRQAVGVALVLGFVLFNYQNCSPGMKADQHLANMQVDENRKIPEIDAANEANVKYEALTNVCYATDVRLRWPLGGTAYKDYIVSNYSDMDPSAGVRDYTGALGSAALSYDAHNGLDISVPSFRYMDKDFPVYAAAAGQVVAVYADSADRNFACSQEQWNFVRIRHSNGYSTTYGHMKKNSITVAVGQNVAAGQQIGVVGSSGCSSAPHVHLTVQDCNNKIVDPYYAKMWASTPPVYTKAAPTTLMDVVMKSPAITDIKEMVDPPPNLSEVPVGLQFSLGMTVASLKPNDVLRIEFTRPNGVKDTYALKLTAQSRYTLSHWWFNTWFDEAGTWKVHFLINGVVLRTETVIAR